MNIPGLIINPWHSNIIRSGVKVEFTKAQMLIFGELSKGYAWSFDHLRQLKSPPFSRESLAVHVSRIRKLIEPIGLTILSANSCYQLQDKGIPNDLPHTDS